MTPISIIFISCFVMLFSYMCFIAQTERNKARERMKREVQGKYREITLAAAGGEGGCHSSAKAINVAAAKIDLTQYKDAYGNILNSDDYKRFIVDGYSMKLCGINHNDLIFVTNGFDFNKDITFPVILVIQKNIIKPDYPDYKIRRTWLHTKYKDDKTILDDVANLIKSGIFQQVRNLPEYPGDDAILEDFKNEKLKQYKSDSISIDNPNETDKDIIISTTLDTSEKDTSENGKIRFSIHLTTKVFGKVVASFKLREDDLRSLNSKS